MAETATLYFSEVLSVTLRYFSVVNLPLIDMHSLPLKVGRVFVNPGPDVFSSPHPLRDLDQTGGRSLEL